MKIKKALIVYKKSSYQKNLLEGGSRHYQALLRQGNLSVKDSRALHDEHMHSLELVKLSLRRMNIPFHTVDRRRVRSMKAPLKFNLVITVGGDGTFLDASHLVNKQLMLGVNSTPANSVGHFTSTDATFFAEKLAHLIDDRFQVHQLQRLQASVGSQVVGPPALNEILFCSENPASTSRYWIACLSRGQKLPRYQEEQKSSGIWISTPAGSTAAFHSAGGRTLPITAVKFAFVVRELYRERGRRYRLTGKSLAAHETLQFIPKMDDAALFVDGAHVNFPVRRGVVVKVKLSKRPLYVIA